MFLNQNALRENLGNHLGDFVITSLISEANDNGIVLANSKYTKNKDIIKTCTLKEKIHNYILDNGKTIDDKVVNKMAYLVAETKEEIKKNHDTTCYEKMQYFLNQEKVYQETIQKEILESKINEFNGQIQLVKQRYEEKIDKVIKRFMQDSNIATDMLAIVLDSTDFETKFETLRSSFIDNANELKAKLNEYYEKYLQQFDENKLRKHQIGVLCASYNEFKGEMEKERRLLQSKHIVEMIQVIYNERKKLCPTK